MANKSDRDLFKELDKAAKKESRKQRFNDMSDSKFESLCLSVTVSVVAIVLFAFFGWLAYQISTTTRTESITERVIEAERAKVQLEKTRTCKTTDQPSLCLAGLK